MGGSQSKQNNTPSPEFDRPWRNTPWGRKTHLETELREFQLSHPDVEYVRILLTGEVGAGKSSFINSINSAFQKRITTEALADATSGTSFTKIYRTYCIRNEDSILPFVFNDIMGLEPGRSSGAHPDDVVKAIKGHLPEGYKLNPASSADDGVCKSNPTPQEQIYCLVYVMAADKLSLMGQDVIEKMKEIRAKASELEIPQAVIMTRIDELCPLVEKDLKNVYISKKIKEKMEECKNLVGVPVSHIFPVKNYHEEIDTNDDIDVLILRALSDLVKIANDRLHVKTNENVKSK